MEKLANKVALVTGGSRGIGAAIVKRLAAEGAKVAFTYHKSAEKARSVEIEIADAGGESFAIAANNSSTEEVSAAVQQTLSKYGGIDILVNNAGIYIGKDFVQHTIQDYEDIMAVNVRAVYVATLAAVKQMKRGGRIINIGSNMADNAGSTQATLYTMSKSALQGFTRGLARDLGPQKITVNLVQPGPIDTDMNPAGSEHGEKAKLHIALGEYGQADDIGSLVAFLASDESKYITGSAITADGGYNA